jgi:hypothetical protein
MSEISKEWDKYKRNNRFYPEKIAKRIAVVEVALNRFLSFLWNGNGDE